ncbi:MAG: hypothetical protein ACJAXQ_001518 [Parvibaculaceae bacterium]|jgi:hypothetical protein
MNAQNFCIWPALDGFAEFLLKNRVKMAQVLSF